MLEALFHRILLLPAPGNRTEPLRCVREIFREPARLVDLSVILYADRSHAASAAGPGSVASSGGGGGGGCNAIGGAAVATTGASDDMALFRLIVDAMEECALALTAAAQAGTAPPANGEAALQAAVECVVALLGSLQTLCTGRLTGDVMDDETVAAIRQRYGHLREVDYRGPLTYQSMARLPAVYRYVGRMEGRQIKTN